MRSFVGEITLGTGAADWIFDGLREVPLLTSSTESNAIKLLTIGTLNLQLGVTWP